MDIVRVVEIGGTHIRRADVVERQILGLESFRTAEILSGDVLGRLKNFTQEKARPDTKALVILIAGPVKENTVLLMPNFPEFPHNFNLKEQLGFNLPVFVFNDMTAAVVGMAELLKPQNITEPFWGLTWSTGLGGKFWDGEKIAVDMEIGHEIFLEKEQEAEKLLGGRNMVQETGKSLEEVTTAFLQGKDWAQDFYYKKAKLIGELLAELDKIAPSNLYVFKGALAKNLLVDQEMQYKILGAFTRDVTLMLSPDPEKDSFLGAAALVKKVL